MSGKVSGRQGGFLGFDDDGGEDSIDKEQPETKTYKPQADGRLGSLPENQYLVPQDTGTGDHGKEANAASVAR